MRHPTTQKMLSMPRPAALSMSTTLSMFTALAMLTALAAMTATPSANAQSLGDPANTLRDTLHNQAASQAQAQAEAERARREELRARTVQLPSQQSEAAQPGPPQGGPCFKIKTVTITGFEPFGKPPEGYQRLTGRCATAADIASAVNRINAHYQASGYITTRAYLPEQDIADGDLNITVVPGRIEGFVYDDGRPADARIADAFPSRRGDLLNLRDIEQGLDNLNAPRSTKARFRLVPAQTVGGSFVAITADDTNPLHASLATANTGFKSTGVVQSTATLGLDNLLGINDQVSLGLSSTPFDRRSNRCSDTLSLSASLPYGNWSFGIDAGASRYFFMLDGINEAYPVSGRSRYVTFSTERLLARDEDDKVFAHGSLKLSRSRSYIDDYEIESQRRNLTVATLGVRGEHLLQTGRLDWDFGTRFGLDALNSYVLDKSIVDPSFNSLYVNLGYRQAIGKTNLTYQGRLNGQWSNSVLPSTEQVTIGGWSNVRGFHDNNLYGDSGVWLSNTLEWLAYESEGITAKLSGGMDFGVIKPSRLRDWDQNYLVGLSLGADITAGDNVALSIRVGHALDRPSDFSAPRTIATLGLTLGF